MEIIQAQSPDLVISDLIMPEMDGLSLVAAARVKFPLVPVILMTSKGSEEIAVQALQAGAASYVPKRKLASQLSETIRKVLEVAGPQRGYTRLLGCLVQSEYTFVLTNDSTLFRPWSPTCRKSVSHLGLGDIADARGWAWPWKKRWPTLCTMATWRSALRCGKRTIRPTTSSSSSGRGSSLFCNRRIHIEAKLSRDRAVFVIRDDGDGFDPASLPDPTDPANLEKASGRGLLLMRTFMDEVSYNSIGNEVTLLKRRNSLSA